MSPRVRSLRLVLALTAAACAPALKEPPPLVDPGAAATPTGAPGDVGALLSKAETLYAVRSLEAVRLAGEVYLEAARADTNLIEGLAGAVRARVWLADHEPEPARREEAATAAVQAAQWCGRAAPESPVCDYWLGAALGVQARERRSTALDALPKIVEAFRRAAAADPDIDEGGPDRALALLYVRAPGWPAGPGDPELGLAHAKKAVELRPGYPPNLLGLAEALASTGDEKASRETYRRALEMARDAAAKGDKDAPEWVEEAEKALASSG